MRRVPAAARNRVRVANVRAFPHAAEPLPDFKAGHSNPPPSTDLFADGRRLTPARFPNAGEGWLQVTNLVGETRTDSRQRVSTLGDFQADLTDLSLWADEPDLRATGYWFVYWSDATRRVTVNQKSAKLRLDGKTAVRKGGVFGTAGAALSFMLFNLLCAPCVAACAVLSASAVSSCGEAASPVSDNTAPAETEGEGQQAIPAAVSAALRISSSSVLSAYAYPVLPSFITRIPTP